MTTQEPPQKLRISSIEPAGTEPPPTARPVRVVVIATWPNGVVVEGAEAQRLLDWNMLDRQTPIEQRPRFAYRYATANDADGDIATGDTWLVSRG